jgi:hypothetical protein
VDRLIASAAEQKRQWKEVEGHAATRPSRYVPQDTSANSTLGRRRRNSDPVIENTSKDTDWMQELALPDGTDHTGFVGDSQGGGPFVKAGDGVKPMIGVRYRIGQWGHACIGELEPLYDPPADAGTTKKDEKVVLAKPGYVVGGMWANGPDYADALRVIFMKATDSGVSIKDQYISPWIGTPLGSDRIKLGCTGQPAIGLFGRQGLNLNAFGLVMKSGGSVTPKDPTDDPNFQGTTVKPVLPVKPEPH